MATIDKTHLFNLFPESIHPGLTSALASPKIVALAVYENESGTRRAVSVAGAHPAAFDPAHGTLLGVYVKPMSRVRKAIQFMQDNPGTGPVVAARHFGITSQNVSITLAREKRKQKRTGKPIICPCCGQTIPETTE
jgi:hypothetical protein